MGRKKKYKYYGARRQNQKKQAQRASEISNQKRVALRNQVELPIPPTINESAPTKSTANEASPPSINGDDKDDIITVFQIVEQSTETVSPIVPSKSFSAMKTSNRNPLTPSTAGTPKMPSITRILVAGEPFATMASDDDDDEKPIVADRMENVVVIVEDSSDNDHKNDNDDDDDDDDDDESVRTASDRDSPISELAYNGDLIFCKYCHNNVRNLKVHYMWIHTKQYQMIRKAFFTKYWVMDKNHNVEDIKRKFADIFTDVDRYANELKCEMDTDEDDYDADEQQQQIDDDEPLF